jgi:hypothetical protein
MEIKIEVSNPIQATEFRQEEVVKALRAILDETGAEDLHSALSSAQKIVAEGVSMEFYNWNTSINRHPSVFVPEFYRRRTHASTDICEELRLSDMWGELESSLCVQLTPKLLDAIREHMSQKTSPCQRWQSEVSLQINIAAHWKLKHEFQLTYKTHSFGLADLGIIVIGEQENFRIFGSKGRGLGTIPQSLVWRAKF